MNSNDLFLLLDAEGSWAGNIEEQAIDSFERAEGVCLPRDYRQFILKYGCGDIQGLEIYGLGVSAVGIPSLEWLLWKFRESGTTIPMDIVPIASLGDGSYAAIVCRNIGSYRAGCIVSITLHSPTAYGVEGLIAESLWAFISQQIAC